jgi:hypothetical protein
MWIRLQQIWDASSGGSLQLFRQEGATTGMFDLFLSNESPAVPNLIIGMRDVSNSGANSSFNVTPLRAQLVDGNWHHVVAGISGFFSGWLDGHRAVYENSFRDLGYSGTITTQIGGVGMANRAGVSISNVLVFDRIPTNGEVRALQNNQHIAGEKARYCIGSTVTGTDLTGNGNNLSTVGTLSGTFTGCDDPPHIALNTTLSKWNLRGKRKTPGTGRLRMLPTSDVADASWLNELGTNTNMYASID